MNRKFGRRVYWITVLVIVLALALPLSALADNVVNNVTVGGNDTFTAPGSTIVAYEINANSGDGHGGCNASDGSPATVTLSVPAGVTASTTSLSFSTCGDFQNVTFSSSQSGTYDINVSNIADSGPGEYKNQANFTLHVLGIIDTTAPVIAAHADVNADATSAAGAIVNYTSPATSDNVDPAGTATCLPASGLTFALGNTTVTCNATDAAGNAATATSFVVHVVDTTAPVIAAHGDETAEATSSAGAVVNYTSPATSDAVDGSGTATCAPASGSQFALGNTTVTCNATDKAGNAATATTFVVHVVDTTAPVIAAHGDETAKATSSAGAVVNYTSPATSDAVDGSGTATCAPASGSQFALGNTTVTCNATDAAGNLATPTTFVVHVVNTSCPGQGSCFTIHLPLILLHYAPVWNDAGAGASASPALAPFRP
jgi:hypothetical protein